MLVAVSEVVAEVSVSHAHSWANNARPTPRSIASDKSLSTTRIMDIRLFRRAILLPFLTFVDSTKEIQRRRTFAIISHPDAGKTTLTEKLLLYGGAVQLAGSVTARKN